MKKEIKKVFLILCLTGAMLFGVEALSSNVYAVEVGQQLLQPEEGWQRIDDSNKLIVFDDSWKYRSDRDTKMLYNGTWHYYINQKDVGSKIIFRFKGTKLRIIGACNNGTESYHGSQEISINVDGKEYESMSCFRELKYWCLLYNLEGLDNSIHTVTITNKTINSIWIDAVDIDKDGCMLDVNKKYVDNITLSEASLSMNVEESKVLTSSVIPQDADNKKITWTSSDSKVCTVDENGKVTGVESGSAVITATANDGSGKVQSCNVKVVDNRRGILTINMNNGKQYTYDLYMPEIRAFDTWYMNTTNGQGNLFYKLTLENGDVHTVNYNNISDYIVHKYR